MSGSGGGLSSISLRGAFYPMENKIRLNERLKDSQRLSTLAHELGHAMQHREMTKSEAQMELEADALGIMMEQYLGFEPTEARKRHLAECYQEAISGRIPEASGREGIFWDSDGTGISEISAGITENRTVYPEICPGTDASKIEPATERRTSGTDESGTVCTDQSADPDRGLCTAARIPCGGKRKLLYAERT